MWRYNNYSSISYTCNQCSKWGGFECSYIGCWAAWATYSWFNWSGWDNFTYYSTRHTVGLQLEQVAQHDDVHDDYQDSANDNGDSTNANQDLLNVFIDAGFRPEIATDNLRTELVTRDPETLQNKDGPFAIVKRNFREGEHEKSSLSTFGFFKKLGIGENILRSW